VLTATVLTQNSVRPLFPVRTNKPLLKTQLKEAARALKGLKVKPPIQVGQILLPNLMNTGVDVIATDDLIS
jgi:CxxC motif-containing protein